MKAKGVDKEDMDLRSIPSSLGPTWCSRWQKLHNIHTENSQISKKPFSKSTRPLNESNGIFETKNVIVHGPQWYISKIKWQFDWHACFINIFQIQMYVAPRLQITTDTES